MYLLLMCKLKYFKNHWVRSTWNGVFSGSGATEHNLFHIWRQDRDLWRLQSGDNRRRLHGGKRGTQQERTKGWSLFWSKTQTLLQYQVYVRYKDQCILRVVKCVRNYRNLCSLSSQLPVLTVSTRNFDL